METKNKMKTEPMRVYQAEVVPVDGVLVDKGKKARYFYTAMDTISRQFGAQAWGCYDWKNENSKPNAFSMFQYEEQADAFKEAVLKSGLVDIVTARVKPIEL
jgi:hypothetical protein